MEGNLFSINLSCIHSREIKVNMIFDEWQQQRESRKGSLLLFLCLLLCDIQRDST
jgi:hypothetical protein